MNETTTAVILATVVLALAGVWLGRPVAVSGGAGERTGDAQQSSGEGADEGVAAARRALVLAERLGLGPLGGLLGGAVVAAAVWLLVAVGADGLLGVDLAADGGVPGFGRRLWAGALWGLIFGISYRSVPGRSGVSRGVAFSLLPASWALFVEYPLFRGQGLAGAELGALTFLVVIGLHLAWGATAGTLLQWAELTSEGSLDRPLGGAAP